MEGVPEREFLTILVLSAIAYLMRNAGWGGSSSQTITNIYNFTGGAFAFA